MDHFDMPSPGLVALVFAVLVVLPAAVLALMPMAIFRAAYRRNLASWVGRSEHVVRAAYRGSSVAIETPPRMPWGVAAASFVSLYVALPVVLVAPVTALALSDGAFRDAIGGVVVSLALCACAVVAITLLRPSREAVLGARVLASYELAFALFAACSSGVAYAAIAAVHALVLLAGAHANVRACS